MKFSKNNKQTSLNRMLLQRVLFRFCAALCKLKKRYIFMPMLEEAKRLVALNESIRTTFPQTFGAIDGCHIAILEPKEGLRDYINRKRFPSIILQAVADCQYR